MIALTAAAAGTAHAGGTPSGAYVCTVEQKAGIAEEHQEGAPPPKAFIDKRVTHFRITITPPGKAARAKVDEAKRTTLHAPHWGTDGWRFMTDDGQAFLRFDVANEESGWLFFDHAGFERIDDVNENISVRSGTCAPVN